MTSSTSADKYGGLVYVTTWDLLSIIWPLQWHLIKQVIQLEYNYWTSQQSRDSYVSEHVSWTGNWDKISQYV